MILINILEKFYKEQINGLVKNLVEYVNISIYSPLSENLYTELPNKLQSSRKGLINIKNSGNKCFIWCHIRHLSPLKIHPERITEAGKKWLKILIM